MLNNVYTLLKYYYNNNYIINSANLPKPKNKIQLKFTSYSLELLMHL